MEFFGGEGDIGRAAALLCQGELVAFGTETVYGLGGDATDARAVAAIFAAKGRPRFNPLICHFPDAAAAFRHVRETPQARLIAEKFWPGALTLVLRRRADTPIDLLAGAGLDTLAVRVPGSAPARRLLAACGRPIAAPSANRSGAVSPTTAAHAAADLQGRIAAVIDFGPATIGLESTVLDLSGPDPVLLRPGGVPREALQAVLGPIGTDATPSGSAPRAPGQLASHYAPALALRLGADAAAAHEALLAFGPNPPPAPLTWNLSAAGDLTEAASRLFAGLRHLDAAGAEMDLAGIAAMDVPDHGLGAAINDRLRRAAAPRA